MPHNTTAYPDHPEQQLEDLILKTEESLRDIRAQLAARRQLQAQYDAIDDLPRLLEITRHRWSNIGIFIDELMTELER